MLGECHLDARMYAGCENIKAQQVHEVEVNHIGSVLANEGAERASAHQAERLKRLDVQDGPRFRIVPPQRVRGEVLEYEDALATALSKGP